MVVRGWMSSAGPARRHRPHAKSAKIEVPPLVVPDARPLVSTPDLSVNGGRPAAAGKFLTIRGERQYIRGITYGTFRPNRDGLPFPEADAVDRDFARMRASGINAVRTYTVPPRWLLDLAAKHDLQVMVGMPWEQHVTFLDDRELRRSIRRRVAEGVSSCAGHPAVLCYSVGNEIPAPIVRWYGRDRIERFIRRLYWITKESDPGGLVTYVNYPTTEYLKLDFLDLFAFNVFLERPERLKAYMARLQNLAGDRPLIMTEIGLDSQRNGLAEQARSLDWQVRTVFEAGAAGAFVFSWTDEWHRGGYDVTDWDFGVTDRARNPKPALEVVQRAFEEAPASPHPDWPMISVALCAYNAASTLAESLEATSRLQYPFFEVIVVDDGSTDATSEIAERYHVRLIRTDNRGLSSARNTALQAAKGEIIAYLDSDAFPDPHWLTYLALSFLDSEYVGIGGPNVVPTEAYGVEECVANAPGGPIHVLVSDTEAEHIPGCNMAFRRDALLEIGGFDPKFRIAGDDVDVCWRLQERGWKLGFSPAAMVWHHRRATIKGYWKQQLNYGRAEAMLDFNLKRWDAAPMYPILTEAGGTFTDWEGRPNAIGGDAIATNGALEREVLELLAEKS